MRITSIIREIWLNTLTGTSRAILLFLVLSVVSASAFYIDASAVSKLEQSAKEFRQVGASTVRLEAPGRVSGEACDQLAAIPGVEASGALRESTTELVASALPSTEIPYFEVTPGFSAVVGSERLDTAGVFLSEQVAVALGEEVGGTFATERGTVHIAGKFEYPDDGRRTGLGYAVLAPTTTTNNIFDACWIDVWPFSASHMKLLNLVVLPNVGDQDLPKVTQLNTSLGDSFDGSGMFDTRNTRHIYLLGSLIGFLLGLVAVRMRRMQHASLLHLGVSRVDLGMIVIGEMLLWLLPSLLVTMVLIEYFAISGFLASNTAHIVGYRVVVWETVGVIAGCLLGLTITREKSLFRYFKER